MVHRESCDFTVSGEGVDGAPEHYHLHLTWTPKHGTTDAEVGQQATRLRRMLERFHDKLNNLDAGGHDHDED